MTSGLGTMDRNGGFFDWWLSELADIFGISSAAARRSLDDGLILRIVKDRVELARLRGGREKSLGSMPLPSRPDRKTGGVAPFSIDTKIARLLKRNKLPVILRLPAEQGIVVEQRFPKNAARELTNIVAHQIDVISPWQSEQVYVDHEVIGVFDDGQMLVRIAMVPRGIIDDYHGRLAGIGQHADVVDLRNFDKVGSPSHDLRHSGLVRPKKPWNVILSSMAVALFALLAGGYFFQEFRENTQSLTELQAYRDALAERLADIPALRAEVEAMRIDADHVGIEKIESPSSLVMLEMLSRAMPANSWAELISLDGVDLLINGFALDATEVLSAIEMSEHFSDVEFRTPSTRVSQVDHEGVEISVDQFGIAAQVAPRWRLAR